MVVSADAMIDFSGVTIQHGLSNRGGATFGRGGINNQGTLAISNSVFTGNRGVPGYTDVGAEKCVPQEIKAAAWNVGKRVWMIHLTRV
jgi:hypothetical protein